MVEVIETFTVVALALSASAWCAFASYRGVSTAAKLVWNLRTPHYFRRTGSAITVGISTFGAASPKAWIARDSETSL